MRWHFTSGIRLAIPILLLSGTWAAEARGAYPLRYPQVAFNSTAVQAFLDASDGGIQAGTDQLDAQVVSFSGIAQVFVVEYLQGTGLEFGAYDPNSAGTPVRCPFFTPASAPRGVVTCRLAGDSALLVAEFDSLANLVRSASYPWAAHMKFGFYVTGPGGTWYSQDARNAGVPHALTYGGTGANTGVLYECFEPGAFDPADPGAFGGLVVGFDTSSCGTPSSRAGRALGVECSPTVVFTWGGLKAIYR